MEVTGVQQIGKERLAHPIILQIILTLIIKYP